uniref:C2H2-type domain-containing protein n=1 Tax=Clastoptera arizonana TaxID=38151 RepID=A0A1B6DX68_9HEMI
MHVSDWSSDQEKTFANYCNYMYKGIGLYDHFIMGKDKDLNPIKYEDCEGRIINVSSIKPRKTKFTPRSYHSCEFCGKWYRSKTSLGLHRRLECGKEPTFQCPYCPLKTHQKGNLQVHVKKKHTEQARRYGTRTDTFNESSSDFDEILSQSDSKPGPPLLIDSATLLHSLGQKNTTPKSKPALVLPKSLEISPSISSIKRRQSVDDLPKANSESCSTKIIKKPCKVNDEMHSQMIETAKKIEAINNLGNIRVEPIVQQPHPKPKQGQSQLSTDKSFFIQKMGLQSVESPILQQKAVVKATTVSPNIEKVKSNIQSKNSLISELLSSPHLLERSHVTELTTVSKSNDVSGNSSECIKPSGSINNSCKIGLKDLKLLLETNAGTKSGLSEDKTKYNQMS